MDHFPLAFKNVLHAHSHFAFGGWLMPVLVLLITRKFPSVKTQTGYRHWRNIMVILLASSYGMLASFPFMGYKPLSIIFSTLSVAGCFYLVFMVYKSLPGKNLTVSERFLKAGLFFLALSAIGPFATGPLIAMGLQGSALYFNSIYFYLHFQINGFFVFAILAFMYKSLERRRPVPYGGKSFLFFSLSVIPNYFLSVLWNQPSIIFNIIGGAAALLQLAGLFFLLKDLRVQMKIVKLSSLLKVIMAAFILKNILQVFSAIPLVAGMAYQYKNYIIAYLHLILLGFVSLFVFTETLSNSLSSKRGMKIFLVAFITTEVLLVAQATGSLFMLPLPYFNELIWFFSLLFPVAILTMISSMKYSGQRLH